MKYCYNCNRVTIGEPLFCNFCGRSYDIKLCHKLHVNPRYAEACSHCGSRELSTPQPKVPFWATILLFFLSLVPGLLLAILSIAAIAFFVRHLLNLNSEVEGGFIEIGCANLGSGCGLRVELRRSWGAVR